MEKQTRVNKYKELREEMKEEVAIDRHVVEENIDEEDDFLAFLPQSDKPSLDDTLVEPLTYESLKHDNEDIKSAIHSAKMNVGKEQYNTRLDILNKIKQEDKEYVPVHEYQTEEFSKGHIVKEESQKKMSLLEKLAAMSPEEDAEELKKFEEGLTVADLMSDKNKKVQKEKKPVSNIEQIEDIDEEESEESSKLVTVLNYVIIVFIIVFIVLAFFIIKQLLF